MGHASPSRWPFWILVALANRQSPSAIIIDHSHHGAVHRQSPEIFSDLPLVLLFTLALTAHTALAAPTSLLHLPAVQSLG